MTEQEHGPSFWIRRQICGLILSPISLKRAYERAGDHARAERMQARIDELLDQYNEAEAADILRSIGAS